MNRMLAAAAALSVAALSGCGATLDTVRADFGLAPRAEWQAAPLENRLPVAPAPQRRVGDSFVFRFPNGVQQAETVTEVRGDRVGWSIPGGAAWTTVTGALSNPVQWGGTAQYGSGQQTLSGNYRELFPMRVGNVIRYSARGESSREPQGWTSQWTCSVPAEERVAVAAGTFDTYRVMCFRAGQLRTYFYAPAIGMYVLRVTTGKDAGRKELVSYRLAGG